ncbi:MAG: GtrA family protein [Paracoccaceae bacterium]
MPASAEIIKFAVVGVTATLVHYGILSAGVDGVGISPVLMNGIAFSVAVLVTYFGQSYWVFQVRRRSAAQLGRFGVSVIAGLIGNMAIMAIAVNGFGLPYHYGFIAGLIIVPATTFLINKFWVFAD